MNCYTDIAKKLPEFISLAKAIKNTRLPLGVTGISAVHKAHIISSLCMGLMKKALVITPDEASATKLRQDMESFGINAYLYPARDFSFRTTETVSREYEHARLKVLDKMLKGEYDAVVLSAEAAMQFTVPPSVLMNNSFSITAGEDYEIDELLRGLVACGYTRSDQVNGPGQFAQRGGILDFYPPDSALPCRVEFWGDTADSISLFETDSQRRTDSLDEISITPAREVLISDEALVALIEKHISGNRIKGDALKNLQDDINKLNDGIRLSSADKYMPLIYPESASIFSYDRAGIVPPQNVLP